ncbi:hypothetical protein DT019_03080 [Streptomyces sp. SDr-06]|uniref:hypothetical protein n=1 Tax=Streptomyces sp. SDr-06 TaxID=2267702 RepID=UPI000DE80EC0|nr:hypothetical protein [Streptomyces sp. SDr-06]RCH70487.1 hypothetical protein DT019_03080 [Streptomyces sp. SDr-06]
MTITLRPGSDHQYTPLSTAASREPLRRVLGTPAPTKAELDADDSAYRARLIELYALARGDWDVEIQLLNEASRYDKAHPVEPSLYDELHAIELFGAQYSEVA